MSGIGIITNPHSKLNKRKPHTPQLLGYIVGEHGRLEITQSLEALKQVAEKFRDAKIEILAINGGDGTINRTITAFIDAYGEQKLPKIALLRGGTMNVLATNLGIRGKPPRVLYRLCEAYSDEKPLPTQALATLKVENSYGFLYADGVSYNVLKEFYKNKTGPIGVSWLIFKLIVSAVFNGDLFRRLIRSQDIIIDQNGLRKVHISCLGIMAATIERMPFRLRVFPAARRAIGKMHFFAIRCRPRQLLLQVPKLFIFTAPKDRPEKIAGHCARLSIHANSGYSYSLDGELFNAQSDKLVIEPGPELDFIVI